MEWNTAINTIKCLATRKYSYAQKELGTGRNLTRNLKTYYIDHADRIFKQKPKLFMFWCFHISAGLKNKIADGAVLTLTSSAGKLPAMQKWTKLKYQFCNVNFCPNQILSDIYRNIKMCSSFPLVMFFL
jgi:hypothetical protein